METYFSAMAAEPGSTDQLSRDLRTLAHDAEQALKSGCRTVGQQTRVAAKRTDAVIRRNPYGSIGLAFGFGVLVGLWVGRK
jgi:ElaB/YqjD/DUF883 family membrane-anchored ribosome-binding protein